MDKSQVFSAMPVSSEALEGVVEAVLALASSTIALLAKQRLREYLMPTLVRYFDMSFAVCCVFN